MIGANGFVVIAVSVFFLLLFFFGGSFVAFLPSFTFAGLSLFGARFVLNDDALACDRSTGKG
jgi:hypothetical protein